MRRSARLAFAPLVVAAGVGTAFIEPAGEAFAGEPWRLMIHVTFDGSFRDDRGLGAVRAEPAGRPEYLPGALGSAASPRVGEQRIGSLRVLRLSRIMLEGRTPAAGTILLWFRPLSADSAKSLASAESLGSAEPGTPADTAAAVLLDSDAPLHLAVAVSGFSPESPTSPRLSVSFDDDKGVQHYLESTFPPSEHIWRNVALAWDSQTGAIRGFIDGEPVASGDSPPLVMPALPSVFELGAPGFAIDDFRLYNGFLDPGALGDLVHARPAGTDHTDHAR